MKIMIKPTLLAVLVTSLVSACSMAPRYHQPSVNIDKQFPGSDAQQTASDDVVAANLGWQEYFADPRLQQLIGIALNNNQDLRIAALNVEAVRAQYAIARADRLPALSATGNGNRGRIAQDLSGMRDAKGNPTSYVSESYNVGLGVTAFELDLFGRVKSLSDAALNQYFAQQQTRDATQISLIASVAKAYFDERVAQAQMDLSAKVLRSREESKKLTDLQFAVGTNSQVDVDVAQSQIETARADYAAAEQARGQARNALVLLLGQPLPDDLPEAQALSQQFINTELPVGLPSTVLYQRPDVRAAEFALKSANANVGAARAAFFPQISLTGNIGSGSNDLGHLFNGPNQTWSFVPQITLPIFTWGQNKANLDLSKARKNIAVAQYEQTVQSAFRDVADALIARDSLKRQYQAKLSGEQAQTNRFKLVKLRFQHGISSSLELLDAERDSYSAQQALLQTQQTLLENRADIYKALGGGLHANTVAAKSGSPEKS
ncbi:efflux transporter outer membrane subunit [Neisseriaceae bacterium ESL0693]|nr:efflux transporter outer membrane subunit [Neisseriaceae bacterium ESL0693]